MALLAPHLSSRPGRGGDVAHYRNWNATRRIGAKWKAYCVMAGYMAESFAQGGKATLGEHVTVQIAKRNQSHSSRSCPNAGSSSTPWPSWRKADGHGKTPNASSTPACNSWFGYSSPPCSINHKQTLNALLSIRSFETKRRWRCCGNEGLHVEVMLLGLRDRGCLA